MRRAGALVVSRYWENTVITITILTLFHNMKFSCLEAGNFGSKPHGLHSSNHPDRRGGEGRTYNWEGRFSCCPDRFIGVGAHPRASGPVLTVTGPDHVEAANGGCSAGPAEETGLRSQSPLPEGETRIFTAVSLWWIRVLKPSWISPSRPILCVTNGSRSILPEPSSSMTAG